MKYIVNSREMKLYDNHTTEHFCIPSIVLMERAACSFVERMKCLSVDLSRVLIVCGSGNNGGDGLAIARLLHQMGSLVDVVLLGEDGKFSEANQTQQKIMNAYGYEMCSQMPPFASYTTVVDAIFGVSLSRSIEGKTASVIEQMNALGGCKIAVDIASGISTDNGNVFGIAFRADITITFGYEKLGQRLWPGADFSGKIYVEDIGITEESWRERRPSVASFEDCDLMVLAERKAHSHKGTFGKLLIIAGSVNMAGAAALTAKAAYAAGCGLVKVITPEENRLILQTQVPEAILVTYPAKKMDMSALTEAVNWADTIVCGPGMGQNDNAKQMVRHVLKTASVPLLFDADALNIIAEDVSVLLRPHTEMIVTPHLGEMSRLTGDIVSYIENHLIEVADEFARQYNVICVLKDARTVTSIPYSQTYLNLSGNAGMAAAGSGDVLSGIIGGFVAQGMRAEFAAPFGVYVHGRAGDIMVKYTGKRGLMASDLPEGVRRLTAQQEQHKRHNPWDCDENGG